MFKFLLLFGIVQPCSGGSSKRVHPNFFFLNKAAPKTWVTEGLVNVIDESSDFSGQGDAMPREGLRIGRVHIVAAGGGHTTPFC